MLVSLPIGDQIGDTFKYGTQENSLGQLIGNAVNVLIILAFFLFLIYFLIGGLNWISSAGDKSKLEGARDTLTNAVIGLAITAAAWAVWLLVQKFFGVSFTQSWQTLYNLAQ